MQGSSSTRSRSGTIPRSPPPMRASSCRISRHLDHPPRRQQRHDLRLHQAPQRDQRRVEEQGPGTGKSMRVARQQLRWQEERRRRRAADADAGLDWLRRVWLRARTPSCRWSQLENKAGKFITPSLESASASLGAVKLPDNLIAWISDPEGEGSYPIVTYTWMLALQEVSTIRQGRRAQEGAHVVPRTKARRCSAKLRLHPAAVERRRRVKKARRHRLVAPRSQDMRTGPRCEAGDARIHFDERACPTRRIHTP
jgi:hypothetical protein